MATEQRQAMVAGATGLVGKRILQGLLADRSVSSVIALLRRPAQLKHAKLTTLLVEFRSRQLGMRSSTCALIRGIRDHY